MYRYINNLIRMHLNIVLRKHVLRYIYTCTHAISVPQNYKTKMHKIINNSNNIIIFLDLYIIIIIYYVILSTSRKVIIITTWTHVRVLYIIILYYYFSFDYILLLLMCMCSLYSSLNTHSCTLFAGGAAFLPIVKKSASAAADSQSIAIN